MRLSRQGTGERDKRKGGQINKQYFMGTLGHSWSLLNNLSNHNANRIGPICDSFFGNTLF